MGKKENIIERIEKKQERPLEKFDYRIGPITLFVNDALTNDVSLQDVIEKFRAAIPEEFLGYIDYIYVGQFSELEQRNVDSLYFDGGIYITNQQKSAMDMVTNLVHEVAHGVEEAHKDRLYSDRALIMEYLRKRRAVLTALRSLKFDVEDGWLNMFEYDSGFDEFLYNEVGYQMLATQSANHFMSPYAMTSVREYFADAFEDYFLGRTHELKSLCPVVYEKIDNLY